MRFPTWGCSMQTKVYNIIDSTRRMSAAFPPLCWRRRGMDRVLELRPVGLCELLGLGLTAPHKQQPPRYDLLASSGSSCSAFLWHHSSGAWCGDTHGLPSQWPCWNLWQEHRFDGQCTCSQQDPWQTPQAMSHRTAWTSTRVAGNTVSSVVGYGPLRLAWQCPQGPCSKHMSDW